MTARMEELATREDILTICGSVNMGTQAEFFATRHGTMEILNGSNTLIRRHTKLL